MRFRVVGAGRAGLSFSRALTARGWTEVATLGRGDDVAGAATGVELVLVAVPDDAIAAVAAGIEPGSAAIVHLSGATSLSALEPHARRASVHPLVSLPDPETGAARLTAGATFAVAGDPIARRIVAALDGRPIAVADARRPLYHAAAAVAANHLVALCAQVQRLAAEADVPAEIYWELMASTLGNVADVGAHAALTGPAARGDTATIAAHLAAMDSEEHGLYLALADAAAELAGRQPPSRRPGPMMGP